MGFRTRLAKLFNRENIDQENFKQDLSAITTRAISAGHAAADEGKQAAYDVAKVDLEQLFAKRQELFDQAIFLAGNSADGMWKDIKADEWKEIKEKEQRESITAQVLSIVRDESDSDIAAMQVVANEDLIAKDVKESDDGYESGGVSFSVLRVPYALVAATRAKPWAPLTSEGRENIAASFNAEIQSVTNDDGSKAVTASFGRFANIGKQADKFAAMVDARLGKKINITGFKKENMVKIAEAMAERGTRDLADITFEKKSAAEYFGAEKVAELTGLFENGRPDNQGRLDEAKRKAESFDSEGEEKANAQQDSGLFKACRECDDGEKVGATALALADVNVATAARAFADIPEAQRSDIYFQYSDRDAAKTGGFLARLDDGVFEKLYKTQDVDLEKMVECLYAADRRDNGKIAQLLDHKPSVVWAEIMLQNFRDSSPDQLHTFAVLGMTAAFTPVLIKAKPETLVKICGTNNFNAQANTVLQLLYKDDASGTCRAKFLNEIIKQDGGNKKAEEIFGACVKDYVAADEDHGYLVQALYKESPDNANKLISELDAVLQAKSLAVLSSVAGNNDAAKTAVDLLIPENLDVGGAKKFLAVLNQLRTYDHDELIGSIVDQLSSDQVQSLMTKLDGNGVKSFMSFAGEAKWQAILTNAVPAEIIDGKEATEEQREYLDGLRGKLTTDQSNVLDGIVNTADEELANKIRLFDACKNCGDGGSFTGNVEDKLLKMTGAKVQAEAFGYIPNDQKKTAVFTKMLGKVDLNTDAGKKTVSEFLVNLSDGDLYRILSGCTTEDKCFFSQIISSQEGADEKLLGVMSAGSVGDAVYNACACYLTPQRMVTQFGNNVADANNQWKRLSDENVTDGKERQDGFLVELVNRNMDAAVGVLADKDAAIVRSSLVAVANQADIDKAADLGNKVLLPEGFGCINTIKFSGVVSELRKENNGFANDIANNLTSLQARKMVSELENRGVRNAVSSFFENTCGKDKDLISSTFNKALPADAGPTDIAVLASSLSDEQRGVIQDKIINEHDSKVFIGRQLTVFDQCKNCSQDSVDDVAGKITGLDSAKAQAAAYSFVPDEMRANVFNKMESSVDKKVIGNMLAQLSSKDLAVEFKKEASGHKALDYISQADNGDAKLVQIANSADFKGDNAAAFAPYYRSPAKIVAEMVSSNKVVDPLNADAVNRPAFVGEAKSFCLGMHASDENRIKERADKFFAEVVKNDIDISAGVLKKMSELNLFAAVDVFARYSDKAEGNNAGNVLNTFSVSANADVAAGFFSKMTGEQQAKSLNNMFAAKKAVDEHADAKTVFNNILPGLVPEVGRNLDKFLEMIKGLDADVKPALFDKLLDDDNSELMKNLSVSCINSDCENDVKTLLEQAGDVHKDAVLKKMVPDGLKGSKSKPEDEDEDAGAKWDDDCDETVKLLGKLDKGEREEAENKLSEDAKKDVAVKVGEKDGHPAKEDENLKEGKGSSLELGDL